MKRICLVLAILALPALLFAAGSNQQQSASGSGGYLRLAWWGNTTRDERTVRLAQLFMDKNPGVTVETEPTQWDGYWQKMNTQAAAGSLPDVMQQDVSYIKQYTDRNQLVDLNAYAQRKIIDLSHWADAGLSAGILDGKLVGLVLGTNAPGMGYDVGVLQKAGVTIDDTTWTWADYERIALQIYQKTGVQTCPPGPTQFRMVMEHTTRQGGIGLFSKDEKSLGMTNNQAAYDGWKLVLDINNRLRAAGALYDPEDTYVMGRAMEEMPLAQGKTWNDFFWSNQYIGQSAAAKRELQYVMIPAVVQEKAPFGTYFRPSQYISMLATSKDKDLSAKFINFFVNDLEANRILLAERGIPIPTDVREDLYGRVDAGNKFLFDFITHITPYISPTDPPYPMRSGEAEDAMRPIVLQALLGRISSDDAMKQIIQAANTVLTR